ncbi:uncharacterized protein VTP21DRAFT_6 [Calcarisporiella thermophila]|uniref:uncharacterized protein n=1 Tax=Calcarisporiella thermophila TaxID=911321 RepID=UPI0037443076
MASTPQVEVVKMSKQTVDVLSRNHKLQRFASFLDPVKIRRCSTGWSTLMNRLFEDIRVHQGVYIGLHFQVNPEELKLAWSAYVSTYTEMIGCNTETLSLNHINDIEEQVEFSLQRVSSALKNYAHERRLKVLAICVSACKELHDKFVSRHHFDPLELLSSRIWIDLDAVPFITFTKHGDLEEMACSASRKLLDWIHPVQPGNIPRLIINPEHNEVQVDQNCHIHMVELCQYERITNPEYWRTLLSLSYECGKQNLSICFLNSTPQGGGVALMRHSIIRMLRMLGVESHWFVPKPNPAIFNITKRKFHNVLQGVAKVTEETWLTEEEKKMWIDWCHCNYRRYWESEGSPLRRAHMIVLDDPQLCAIIPLIKQTNPKARIVYRSHIEIRSDLATDKSSIQHNVWCFLWQFIQHADIFVSHPISGFIPPYVDRSKTILMPASTDPLDGLNKPLLAWDIHYYRQVFNRACLDQNSPILQDGRPYIIQIARFDPSKGYRDCIEAYRILREKLKEVGYGDTRDETKEEEKKTNREKIPQLVLCGHGSIDDPDGGLIYEQLIEQLGENKYEAISNDICVARIAPCDQLLNALMRGSFCALQLSHREGFEVKVTEALAKGKPVVAYSSGGIPLQIDHGKTGYLLPRGDVEGVAQTLFNMLMGQKHDHELMVHTIRSYEYDLRRQEYYTPFQCINWLYLLKKLAWQDKVANQIFANIEKVRDSTKQLNISDMYRFKITSDSQKVLKQEDKQCVLLGSGEIHNFNAAYIKECWINEFKIDPFQFSNTSNLE